MVFSIPRLNPPRSSERCPRRHPTRYQRSRILFCKASGQSLALFFAIFVVAALTAEPVMAGRAASGILHSPQNTSPKNTSARRIRFRPTVPPPDRGTPRAPYGTGSRGDCRQPADLPPLAALVGGIGLDQTSRERPSYWVYVPYTSSDTTYAAFSLQQSDSEVYRQMVQLPQTPGIVEISLADDVPVLEIGQPYRWYFEISCPQSDPAETPMPATVTGTVTRVERSPSLQSAIAAAQTPADRVVAYVDHQLWYDTFTELARLRQQNPMDETLADMWESLLSDPDIMLELWADAPFVSP